MGLDFLFFILKCFHIISIGSTHLNKQVVSIEEAAKGLASSVSSKGKGENVEFTNSVESQDKTPEIDIE